MTRHQGAHRLVISFMAAVAAVSISLTSSDVSEAQATTFTCTQFIGYSQTNQWLPWAAITMNAGGPDRVQLLWNSGGAAHKWADPTYVGWSNALQSPCAQNASAPDRVIMDVTHDEYLTMARYGDTTGYMEQVIRSVVATIRQRYPSVRQIVLQPVVGGPNETTCSWPGAEQGVVRASYNHPIIRQAALRVVGGSVVFGANPGARTCADYADDQGHLISDAATDAGNSIGQFYLNNSPPPPTATAPRTATRTPTRTPTLPAQGASGQYSASFNGTTAFAEAPHAAELNVADWTVEIWFKDDNPSYDHGRTRILTKGDIASANVPYFASIDSNLLFVGFRFQGSSGTLIFNLAEGGVSPNAWHHLAATFQASSGTMRMYLDGTQRAMGTFGPVTPATRCRW